MLAKKVDFVALNEHTMNPGQYAAFKQLARESGVTVDLSDLLPNMKKAVGGVGIMSRFQIKQHQWSKPIQEYGITGRAQIYSVCVAEKGMITIAVAYGNHL